MSFDGTIERPIFVFGSNLAGRHGKGAALHAKKHFGAKSGVGEGRTGHAYAIPTKDERLRTLPLDHIKVSIDRFLDYCRSNPLLQFQLTPIGCGLAGYDPVDIAPLFRDSPPNVIVPVEFREVLQK